MEPGSKIKNKNAKIKKFCILICNFYFLFLTFDFKEELQQRFEALVSFLKSPESQRLRDESEKYLAEGKHVTVSVCFDEGKPRYELKIIDEKNGGTKS